MAWDADITNDKINRKNKNKKSDNKESYYENQQNKECEIDHTGGASENKYKYCDLDIPFGFQDIDSNAYYCFRRSYWKHIIRQYAF